jgi:dienelactone hydrolase
MKRHIATLTLALMLAACGNGLGRNAEAGAPSTVGPWTTAEITAAPAFALYLRADGLVDMYMDAIDYNGNPDTRVWGIYAPSLTGGPSCAVIVLHGGGGTATASSATPWQSRGYAALALDLGGLGPDGLALVNGSIPDNQVPYKYSVAWSDVSELWAYHATAHVLRAVALLRSLPGQVDASCIAVIGSSWGGVAAALATGVDARLAYEARTPPRIRGAAMIYGVGHLADDAMLCAASASPSTECAGLAGQATWYTSMSYARNQTWIQALDPASYMPYIAVPLYHALGMTDANFSGENNQAALDLAITHGGATVTHDYRATFGHSDGTAWAMPALYAWMASIFRPGVEYLNASATVAGSLLTVAASGGALASATLRYTMDATDWGARAWTTSALAVSGQTATGASPPVDATAWYVTITDTRGYTASTPMTYTR